MAGRGQHFIPQHFQKPFVIPGGNDNLWMYRRGVPNPVPVSRKDAAKQNDFYSSPSIDGVPTLDDLITEYEYHLTASVNEIREIKCGDSIPPIQIAKVAVHLTFRSAYLRNILVETIGSLFENISESLQNHDGFLFGENTPPAYGAPPRLEKILVDIIEDAEGFQSQTITSAALARIGYILLREKKNKSFDGAIKPLDISQNILFSDPESFVTGSHRKLLSEELEPKSHVNTLSQFDWTVVAHTETAAILPDCVCFGIDHDGNIQPLLLLDEKVEMVILPLSPSTLAVGKRDHIEFDPDTFNDLALKASFEFFLSSELKPELVTNLSKIGGQMRSNVNSFAADIVASKGDALLIDDSIQTTRSTRNLIEEIKLNEDDELASINLTFMNGVDIEQAKLIGQNVSHVVNKFLSPMIVSSFLDKIIFVNNYRIALDDIHRGYEINREKQTDQDPYDEGVGSAISINQDGVYKSQIILKGYIGDFLLSEQEEDQIFALTSLSHTLASVEFLYIEKEKFPELFLKPIEDPIEGFLQNYAAHIFANYYISSTVSLRLETIEELETKLIELIEPSFQEIVEKRRVYRESANLDDFFPYAAFQAKDILITFAKLFAILNSLSEERLISEELANILVKFDLENWALQFRKDLSDFYNDLSNWSDYKQLFFVNRHFERWLFVFGIVVDLNSDGNVYIHVPHWSDADYLESLIDSNA